MKKMMKVQFGIKKQEKETQTECHQDKLGELFKLVCLMMLLFQVTLETIVQLEMHIQLLKREENI